jgi:transglutaminase-like putative cysteine protease/Tfp pilus assembly protein PilF
MDVFIREDANTLLSLELEKVKKQDKNNPLSLQLLYNEAIEEKDYDKAEDIVDQIEDIFGKNKDVYSKRIDILGEKEEQEDMIRMMKEAYSKFPNTWTFVNYKYLIAVKVYNNYGEGLSVLKKFVKNNYNKSAIEAMAGIYANLGSMPKAIKLYKMMEKNEEYLPGYTNTIAATYAGQSDYPTAIEYYNKLLKKAPYVGYYMGQLASAYKEDGLKEKAIEYFEKALLYDPTDFDTRKVYREYTDKKAIFDYFEKPDLYKLYEESETAEDYPEDNSLIIKYETQKVVYHEGGSEEKIYLLIKVFNSTGIDQWKDYNLSRNADIEKAEVLKANGNKLKAETNNGQIVFTNLEEGDAILLIYSLKYANSGKLLKHFWDDIYFDYRFPYNDITYSMIVQDGLPFTYKMNHSDMKPIVEKMDDEFTKYTWEQKDNPSVKTERYMPAYSDFAATLNLSTVTDWNWINKWYYDISTTKAKSDFEVQDVTHKLLEGKDDLSDLDKIKLIYNYVVKNIHYSSIPFRQNGVVPQKASKVINTKIGDCKDVSTLFVAMCREAGYKAEIVLVNTRDNGQEELFLPNIGFNHAIAKVYVDDTYYIVELTSDLNPFSTMGSSLKGAFVLEINGESSEPYLLDSKTRLMNAFYRETIVDINGDDINITRNAIKYGDYAASARNAYRDIGEKKRKQKIQRAISDDYAHTKLNSIHFDSTLYTNDDSMTYTYNFDITDAFTQFGSTKLIELPFTVKQKPIDFINNPERKYDLDFWKYINDDYRKEKLVINIPKNLKLSEMPKNKIYSSPYADYSLTFKKTGNKLIAIRHIVFKKDIVPASDFSTFSDFYAKVIKADKTQIGFKAL